MWAEVSTQVTDGVHQTPTYVDEGVPFISVENLTNGPGINMASKRFITQAAHAEYIKRAHPQKGDVLLAGKGATLGAARVVETDEPFSIFVSVALIKPNRSILDPWFLRYFLESTIFLRRLRGLVSGSALPQIHLVDLRKTPIPIPNMAEQLEAVKSIRQADAALQDLELRLGNASSLSNSLIKHCFEAQ